MAVIENNRDALKAHRFVHGLAAFAIAIPLKTYLLQSPRFPELGADGAGISIAILLGITYGLGWWASVIAEKKIVRASLPDKVKRTLFKILPVSYVLILLMSLCAMDESQSPNERSYNLWALLLTGILAASLIVVWNHKLWTELHKLNRRYRTILLSVAAWFLYVVFRTSGQHELLGYKLNIWNGDSFFINFFLPPTVIGGAYQAFRWASKGKP